MDVCLLRRSLTDRILVQRSPTECGTSLSVIRCKNRQRSDRERKTERQVRAWRGEDKPSCKQHVTVFQKVTASLNKHSLLRYWRSNASDVAPDTFRSDRLQASLSSKSYSTDRHDVPYHSGYIVAAHECQWAATVAHCHRAPANRRSQNRRGCTSRC